LAIGQKLKSITRKAKEADYQARRLINLLKYEKENYI